MTLGWQNEIAALFRMTDEVWARHANPWSVWTRTTCLPLLLLALWSRAWIGGWSLLPVAAALLWTWANPRVFPRPRSTNNWASKAVLGERVWLNRQQIPVPPHHRRAPRLLAALAAAGAALVVWGVAAFAVCPTLIGFAVVYLAKLWFLDRMVWLYEDMKDASLDYQSWLY